MLVVEQNASIALRRRRPRVRARGRARRARGHERRAQAHEGVRGRTWGTRWHASSSQQVVSGLATGAIYASLALALVLIYRATDIINFAQGEMAMFTTFIAWALIAPGCRIWPALRVTLAIAFVGGVAIERVVIRPVESAARR